MRCTTDGPERSCLPFPAEGWPHSCWSSAVATTTDKPLTGSLATSLSSSDQAKHSVSGHPSRSWASVGANHSAAGWAPAPETRGSHRYRQAADGADDAAWIRYLCCTRASRHYAAKQLNEDYGNCLRGHSGVSPVFSLSTAPAAGGWGQKQRSSACLPTWRALGCSTASVQQRCAPSAIWRKGRAARCWLSNQGRCGV